MWGPTSLAFSMEELRDPLFLQSIKDRNDYPNNLLRNAGVVEERGLQGAWGNSSSSSLRRQGSDKMQNKT